MGDASAVLPRRRILFLLYRFPYPLIGGDRVKTYHLLKHFAKIADVDLITLDESSEITAEYVKELKGVAKLLIAEDARIIMQERATQKFRLTPQYIVRKIDAKRLK